ncbi:uncharacterized protein N7482_007746 [Penicillium canariense]|uniref:Uncharacterized protein n=1 Tax=Penicillium canariense TaxID=189055 RepID=A0A9W9LJG1_9EURO|nr:uncharacterized protein N7482_007746 [Penicillium canariense]KAJ5160742.1 hypothetical protein N7482_007746 [Penicillium canariense]
MSRIPFSHVDIGDATHHNTTGLSLTLSAKYHDDYCLFHQEAKMDKEQRWNPSASGCKRTYQITSPGRAYTTKGSLPSAANIAPPTTISGPHQRTCDHRLEPAEIPGYQSADIGVVNVHSPATNIHQHHDRNKTAISNSREVVVSSDKDGSWMMAGSHGRVYPTCTLHVAPSTSHNTWPEPYLLSKDLSPTRKHLEHHVNIVIIIRHVGERDCILMSDDCNNG